MKSVGIRKIVVDSLFNIDYTVFMMNNNGPVIGKFFDMSGYDTMAWMQSASDDYVRVFILSNNSSHFLVAEAHSDHDATEECQEPAKLVASYAYAAGDEGWRVAYRNAVTDASMRAL